MPRTLLALLAGGTLALGVAACGGSSSASSHSSGTGASTATPTTTVTQGATGGAAVSSKLSISAPKSGALMFSTTHLAAKAGTVTITFTNQSSEGHNLTVVRGGGGKVIGATPTFSDGSKVLTLHLTAGKYTYYCSVPGHRAAGMQGTLTVS